MKEVIKACFFGLMKPNFSIRYLFDEIDKKYFRYIISVNSKFAELKRNLILTLECQAGIQIPIEANLASFATILSVYAKDVKIEKFVDSLKFAETNKLKLLFDEQEFLNFSYYSPVICDDANLEMGIQLDGSLFSCIYNYLKVLQKYWNLVYGVNIDDEEFPKMDTYNVFIDSTMKCFVRTHLNDRFYSNVYIECVPGNKFHYLQKDFIQYQGGFLYTVEFVEDINRIKDVCDLKAKIAENKQKLENFEKLYKNYKFQNDDEKKSYEERRNQMVSEIISSFCINDFM